MRSEKTSFWPRIVALMISVLTAVPFAGAQQPVSEGDRGAGEELARRFVRAVNRDNLAERKALLHPKSQGCINAQTQPYFDWIFSRQLNFTIPENYKVKVETLPAGVPLPPEAKATHPIMPTYSVAIEYQKGPYSYASVMLSAVKEGGVFYEVLPCPEPDAVKRVQSKIAGEKVQDEKVKTLVAGIAQPLRAEVESLAKKGQRLDAVKRYQAASGEDLTTSVSVVNALVPKN